MAGQKQRKGKAGNAVQYITRTQALRKLQLSLAEFRKLCIVKGIHPREPNKKSQGQHKTYYHIKDIHFLAHEPLVHKYREAAIFERKIRKARAKRNEDLARRLRARRPSYKLDHLVKERYPMFVDALRDLDDALTMIHLFATLPAAHRHRIPGSAVATSRRLALEWQAYIVRTHALRKTFVSVKGFYYQAEVQGQTITWLVPHQLAQVLPTDVDYRVMCTFLEFYQTLLQFVNFKLYHSVGAAYPPVVDPRMEEAAEGLAAIMEELAHPAQGPPTSADAALTPEAQLRLDGLQDKLHDLQQQDAAEAAAANSGQDLGVESPGGEGVASEEPLAAVPSLREAREGSGGEDAVEGDGEDRAAGSDAGALVASEGGLEEVRALVGGAIAAEDDSTVCATLFSGLVFFLGREVPREQLLVVIRSFGGQVGWAGEESPMQEDSDLITHQIYDRPSQERRHPGREYVQPQWIVDSANFRVLVDPRLYAPGQSPPPHLSPFVEVDEDEYVPDYLVTLQKMQASAKAMRLRAQGIATDAAFLEEEGAAAMEEGEREAAELAAAEGQFQAQLKKEVGAKRKAEEEAEAEDSEDDAPEPGAPAVGAEEASLDEQAMNKAMMKRKDRNLYQSIMNRKKASRQKVERLTKRKKENSAKAGK